MDDGSTDATAALAREAAVGDRRLTVIDAGPLPAGWTGKSHACWLGAAGTQAAWLCFIDADTMAHPTLLRSAVTFAARRDIAPRRILPDSAIIEAAIADPKTVDDLVALPVFGGRNQRRSAAMWLAALEAARESQEGPDEAEPPMVLFDAPSDIWIPRPRLPNLVAPLASVPM